MADLDILTGDVIWICKKYDKASSPMLQRLMGIDFHTAEKIFAELEKMEVIIHVKTIFDGHEDVRVGEVNKEKIKELSKN